MSLLQVDVSALLEEYTADMVRRVVDRIYRKARELVPVDLGDLKDSITPQTGKGTGMVFSTSPYALAIEFGNDAHPIPNSFGRGETLMHPGNAPHPFLAPAVRYAKKSMSREAVESFRRVAMAKGLPSKGVTVIKGKAALPPWRR